MPVSDVEVWVDSNGDQTCDLKLNRPFGVTYSRRFMVDGEATFRLTNDDSQRSTVAIKRRAAIVHTATATVLWSGRVCQSREVEVDAGEHSGMVTEFSLRDDFVDLRRIYIRPWVYEIGASRNPLATRPIDGERRMGWRDPTYFNVMADTDGGGPGVPTYYSPGLDGHTWTPAAVLYPVGSQLTGALGRNGNPTTFPTPATKVIWSRAIVDSAHPQGDVWLHGWCPTPPGKTGFVFHMFGDDAYEVWLNDTLLAAVENDEADQAFLKTKRVVVNRSSDEIGPLLLLNVRCRNQGPNIAGDVGGFGLVCRAKGSSDVVLQTDSGWYALDYPALASPSNPVPGMPVGFIFQRLWGEGIERLADAGHVAVQTAWSHLVDRDVDSNDDAYPLFTDLPIPNGSSFFDVLKAMQIKCDFDYVPTKGVPGVRLWSGEGVALVGGGVGAGKGVTFGTTIEKGVNALEIVVSDSDFGEQWNEGWANALVYTWRNGWGDRATAAVDAGTEARVEQFYAFGADLEQGEVEAQVDRMLALMGASNKSFAVSIAPLPGLIPGVNFDVGDKLPVKAGGVTYTLPVSTITGSVDEDGFLTHVVEVGQERDAAERRFEQFMSSVAKGVEFERGAPTPPPSYDVTYVDESLVEYSCVFRNQADAASDDTNHLEARAQGKLTFLSLRAADVLAEDLTATLYINGVSAGAITLTAGQLYSYLTFDSGTIVPLQSILFVRFETDAEEANVTCTVRVGEYV